MAPRLCMNTTGARLPLPESRLRSFLGSDSGRQVSILNFPRHLDLYKCLKYGAIYTANGNESGSGIPLCRFPFSYLSPAPSMAPDNTCAQGWPMPAPSSPQACRTLHCRSPAQCHPGAHLASH
jgi:hypothetical protein